MKLFRTLALALAVTGLGAALPGSVARAQPAVQVQPSPSVRSTILPGAGPVPPPAPTPEAPRPGDVSLNYPKVDVTVAAQAILGDILHLEFAVDPSVHGVVSVVTPSPIRRADVLAFFEDALKEANLALERRGDTYAILPLETARAQAGLVAPTQMGFGSETIQLRYVSAEQLKALLDPIVPGVIVSADPTRNLLVIAGTTGQRKAIRDLAAQFDVDWLRGMSFALFVPQHTDARLIAPELDKLLNGPGAETAGLVRLIPMENLNGILAVSTQPALLEDARRFVEVLDREGEGAERRIFVYKVQNGRASDLAKVLDAAFGIAAPKENGEENGPADLFGAAPPPAMTPNFTPPQSGPVPAATVNPAIARALPGAAGLGPAPPPPEETASQPANPAAGVTITADDTTNSLVVYATPRQYALIQDALTRLDVLPLEVLIDAAITEVTLNNKTRFGIQWSAQGDNRNFAAFTKGPTGVPLQAFPGFSYLYTGNGVSATINALSKTNDVNVLSAPKLVVLNNHTAEIQVGDQVPIATGSAVSTLSSGAPIVNSIEYRDTGVILKVTPRVNASGLVLLDITQEVSDVTQNATSSINSPTIQQRKIATSVVVQDGATIALGGLIRNSITKNRNGLPVLSDIPGLGLLFGNTHKLDQRTELIVLLTPRVIRTADEAHEVTEELREKINLAAPDHRASKGRP
ncbi:MAG TPA: type II secretion system secretin GspD [Caulobacteraceae bacterium]|nr:type II secretion system secretin GspD [Caulobacteraceae bacterium]